ncbi:oocyte zinc finger protein XlCOF6-like [Physella acuta]|uniref:oocyte zinc finger protein XlCOF6-like n=1 Tax=Physella acuta TaxID=109671 RepID=UPI0027DB649D|nr:oocyte zinc finger protein XlCOF6-like [Physella acuta]XP_059171275.1 oocyte zinc finger protein XlCOF6-like [Physella acuta]
MAENIGHHSTDSKTHHYSNSMLSSFSLHSRVESLLNKGVSHSQQHIMRPDIQHELDIVNQSLSVCLDSNNGNNKHTQLDHEHINEPSTSVGVSFQPVKISSLHRNEGLIHKNTSHNQHVLRNDLRHDLDIVNQSLASCVEDKNSNNKQRMNPQMDNDHINESSTSGNSPFHSVKPSSNQDMADYFMYTGNNAKINVEALYSSRGNEFTLEKEQLNKNISTDDDGPLYNSEVFKSSISTPNLQDDVTLEKIFKCELCSKIFSNSFFLRQHTLFHTGDKQFVCGTCGHKCFYKSQLKEHERTHTGEKPHKCHICETGFARKDALKRHLRSHMDEKPYKCDVCEKEFKHKPYLQIHKKTHTGERPHKCEICEKMFSRIESLKRHRISHIKDKAYPCNYCDKSFKCLTYLHNHTQNHTGQKLYGCDLCEKKFKYPALLKKHKMKHTGERPFRCDLCDKGYFTATELKIHKMNHAATDPPFHCDFCGKGFHMNDLFQAHVRTHAGDRLKCRYCESTFTQQSALLSHERMHTGDKPYVCNTCGLTYTQLASYNAHIQTHIGEMPYKCEPCGRRYQHYASFRYHQNVCAFYNPPVPKQNPEQC